jgi:hypothetical protein
MGSSQRGNSAQVIWYVKLHNLVNCIASAPWQCGLVFVAGSSDGLATVLSHAQDRWEVLQYPAHKSGVTAVSCGLGPGEEPKQVFDTKAGRRSSRRNKRAPKTLGPFAS